MSRTGRPRKYPSFDLEQRTENLIKLVVELFGEAYDDRELRDPDAPSINEVAEEMGTTGLRVRKLLITAGYYSTAISRTVQEMHAKGSSTAEIMEKLNISRASVNGYLPYDKGVYKLSEPTLYSEQSARYRNRRDSIINLREAAGNTDELDCLWNAIVAFENYPFFTIGHKGQKQVKFTYSVLRLKNGGFGNEIKITTKEKTVARATVEYGYTMAKDIQQKEGFVSGPKKIKTPGASSYLYPVFIRLGVITAHL